MPQALPLQATQPAIDKVELRLIQTKDFDELQRAMTDVYAELPEAAWTTEQLTNLLNIFPEGQVVIVVDGEIAGCALSIRVPDRFAESSHTYVQATGNYTFSTHVPEGKWLYGVDVFVCTKFRGLRLGRRMYDYRKELAERLNLKGIVFGGRLPRYAAQAQSMSAREYINKVRSRELHDPVLNFQLSNDFHVRRILKDYLPGDAASKDYAALMVWDNVYYQDAPDDMHTAKVVVRLGLVQWQMRPYKRMEDLVEQLEYFVDAVSDYRCDFVLFPEFFNAPLMAEHNHLATSEAIRKLAEHTDHLRDQFSAFAVSYNINIITGSMPEVGEDNVLRNAGYLCRRDGSIDRFEKIHVTPDEVGVWGTQGGSKIQTYDTDCGKIGILICYDVEFPELSRMLAEKGMQILFVPFLTDTQNGYSRVRHCAQARAIENECYVAMAGSVGNLPKVHNMDMSFAQSMVFTPCDFAFPTNGVKAEATPNAEMVLIADVDLDLLKELHERGSVRNLKDRRSDVYEVKQL